MNTRRHGSGLRLARIVISVVAFAAVTGLFTSASMTWPRAAKWLADIQLMPAAVSFSLAIFVVWIIVTLLFGRVYCSTVCPLGVFQDICSRLARSLRHRDFHYSQPRTTLRNLVLVATVGCLVGGVSVVATLIDPYSAWGRVALDILRPVWLWLTSPAGVMASASALGAVIALLTALIVGVIAALRGRTYCNTICPVGTTLGYVSRYSVFHIDIDTDKCIQCRHCEHACKSSCIDMESHVVDMSRCVVCFDCLPVCPNYAIHYTFSRHTLSLPMMQRISSRRGETSPSLDTSADAPASPSAAGRRLDRRRFIMTGVVAAMAPVVARAERAMAPDASQLTPVMPPGVASADDFLSRCTGCGLCVSHCPTNVMRPSLRDYGLANMLKPVLRFDDAHCDWSCTRCNNLCPTGALTPLTLAEKRQTVIGRAWVNTAACVGCGSCERACPRHAITMADRDSRRVAVVSGPLCIGCGACQNACPVTPVRAVRVDGLPFD